MAWCPIPRPTLLFRIMDYLGEVFALAYSALIISIFYIAYYDPNSTVIINVNIFGEAQIEFWLVTVSIPCIIIAVIQSIKRIRYEFQDYHSDKYQDSIHKLITLDKCIYLTGIITIILGMVIYLIGNMIPVEYVAFILFGLGALQIKLKLEDK